MEGTALCKGGFPTAGRSGHVLTTTICERKKVKGKGREKKGGGGKGRIFQGRRLSHQPEWEGQGEKFKQKQGSKRKEKKSENRGKANHGERIEAISH